MPRRISKPTLSSSKETERSIRVERVGGGWQTFVTSLQSERSHVIVGIILLLLAVMLLIACLSFLFQGAGDYSAVAMADRTKHLGDFHNALGLPGAVVSQWLVEGTFGVMILVPIVALGIFAVWLIHRFEFPMLRMLFCTLFALLWGAVAVDFIQIEIAADSFFDWGGVYGQWLASTGIAYIHTLGMLLLLPVVLVIFLALIDAHFIDHCHTLGAWFKHLFSSRKEDDDTDASATEDQEPEMEQEGAETREIPIVIEELGSKEGSSQEEIPITIEVPSESSDEPSDDSAEEDAEAALTIEEPTDVEMTEQQDLNPWENLPPYDPRKDLENYHFPGLNLLKVYDNETAPVIDQAEQQANANRIVTTLRNFDIEIESIRATVGPTVTLYEIVPKAGIKISKIQGLESDIMLSLSAKGIRIIAPMPGKGTIGIEVPNENPQVVSMHSVIASKRFQEEKKMKLPIVIGRTITNEVFMFDLAKTPHLLVAGATGQGKSVAINAIITSLLYKKHPAELKFVLVDPKMVEFAPYKDLMRHYLAAMPDTDPNKIIITDCSEVINTLNSLVIEMENRYKLLMDAGVRNVEDYNAKFVARHLNPEKLVDGELHHCFLPYIVIIIDEYGDFIMQVGKQVETPIARITQKARAVGMHMILATQRPSVNIVTGVIKANIPTRIALRTQSVVDSRTVLDAKGADQLIGRGDMLYSGNGDITRIQCAFVDTPEVDAVVDHIRQQQHYFEPYPLPEYIPEGSEGDALTPGSVDMKHLDPMFADVARYVVSKQEGSTSRLQRAFEIGYNRAGKLSDQLEAAGIVGPNKGPKGRDVLIQDMDTLNELLIQLNV